MDWWSWVLTAIGVAGFFLAGRKVWWSWYVNIANQGVWLAYALITEQYGFLAGVAIYLWVFIGNARKWTKEHFEGPSDATMLRTTPRASHNNVASGGEE